MQHKKQCHQNLVDTIKWNHDRGNTPDTLDWNLEIAMLQEELDELKTATEDVDRLDALIDLNFVLKGTLSKMNLAPEDIVDAETVVLHANQQKSKVKDSNGKIIKDKSTFIEPEPELQKILDRRI